MRYYELENDRFFKDRWHLCDLVDAIGVELDSREFTYAKWIDPGPPLKCSLWNEETIVEINPPLSIMSSRDGTPLDFTYTDDGAPVVTTRVAALLSKIASKDFQSFPIHVNKMQAGHKIINVVTCIDCIDSDRSKIDWYEEGNDIRPDLAGTPKLITNLLIDPIRANGNHILRPAGWEIAIIVSDVIKQVFEEANVTGVLFKEV
jgi:hypothetical protein